MTVFTEGFLWFLIVAALVLTAGGFTALVLLLLRDARNRKVW